MNVKMEMQQPGPYRRSDRIALMNLPAVIMLLVITPTTAATRSVPKVRSDSADEFACCNYVVGDNTNNGSNGGNPVGTEGQTE